MWFIYPFGRFSRQLVELLWFSASLPPPGQVSKVGFCLFTGASCLPRPRAGEGKRGQGNMLVSFLLPLPVWCSSQVLAWFSRARKLPESCSKQAGVGVASRLPWPVVFSPLVLLPVQEKGFVPGQRMNRSRRQRVQAGGGLEAPWVSLLQTAVVECWHGQGWLCWKSSCG